MKTDTRFLVPALSAIACSTTLFTSLSAATPEEQRSQLKKLVVNSQWSQSNSKDTTRPPLGVVVFRDLGKCTSTGWFADGKYAPLFYVIEAPNVINLYHNDPRNDRKGTPHWTMAVNLEERTAVSDPARSTIPGFLFLSYKEALKK